MNLVALLKNLSKTHNSLVDKAKVPEEAWKPQEDLPAEDKEFFVRDETAVISGALDQGIEELREIPDMVGLGLTLVSDPAGTYEQFRGFVEGITWESASSMAKEVVRGAVFADEFEKGGKYALHGTGRAGVVIAKAGLTGGGLLLLVRKTSADVLALLKNIEKKLKDLNWSQADIERFGADLGTLQDVLKAFDDGFLDFDASKVLVLGNSGVTGKNLRRVVGNLRTLTNLKQILPPDITLDDIRGFIAKATNKQDVLDELAKFDATNVESLGEYIKNKGIRTFASEKGPVGFNGSPSSDVMKEVNKRRASRADSRALNPTAPDYDSQYKAHMKAMRDASEKSAELMADIHFGKTNEVVLSLPNTTSKQGQFDRVYKTTDPQTGAVTWHVVECKGGASELGSRQGHQQCTKPYIESVIQYLRNTNQLTNDQLDRLDELEEALNMTPSKVKSWKLQQKFDDDGNLGTTGVTEYNI